MIFRSFGCDEAEGIILAHTLRLPVRTLKKGCTLNSNDVEDIRQAGIENVAGAHLEDDDVDENSAAFSVATALAGANLRVGKPAAGRCNLYSTSYGLAVIDQTRVDAINLSDGQITVATLPDDNLTSENQVVACVKVIPFAVSKTLVKCCCSLAKGKVSSIAVTPFEPHRVVFIQTKNTNSKSSLLDSTREVTQQRLQMYGSSITKEVRCNHTEVDIRSALQSAISSDCELIMICGATITVDVGDVVPTAIVDEGGVIDHFGMPVEPGNMLLLARHGRKTIINLPGCGRSPKLNGLDWILQRTLTGRGLSKRDILLRGVGGLIKDMPLARKKTKITSQAVSTTFTDFDDRKFSTYHENERTQLRLAK